MNKQTIRRTVIREWMALPRDKRQTQAQTAGLCRKDATAPRASAQPPRLVSGDDGVAAAADRETVTDAHCTI